MSEFKTRIEQITAHKFLDEKRLTQAFTHASVNNDLDKNYERLEFLGDRVLGLMIAQMLIEDYPEAPEGELSVRLNALVNAETCAAIAQESNLVEFIKMGNEMRGLEGRRLLNTYADVVESLIGVIYLDGGLEAVRPFITRYWKNRAKNVHSARRDPKTELQEWAHRKNGSQPAYRVTKRKGPDHDPIFEVEVRVHGLAPSVAKGRSKRLAERESARLLLVRENVWDNSEEDEFNG